MINKKIVALVIAVIMAIGAISMTGCAALDSASKDWQAYSSYLNRKVVVYHPYTGEILFEREGKMLVDGDTTGIAITTEDGHRFNIGNCTFVVEERC